MNGWIDTDLQGHENAEKTKKYNETLSISLWKGWATEGRK